MAEPQNQGRCDTTLTERFANPDCQCVTYAANLGPCKTFQPGANSNCAYCDHAFECHVRIISLAVSPVSSGEAKE